MSDEIEVFLNKVDAFANGLTETEQAMLAYLVSDDEDNDVAGFSSSEGWPTGIANLAPKRVAALDGFLSSGHTTGFLSSGHTTGARPGDGTSFTGPSGTGKT